jgi:hypothetical protein
MGGAPGLDDSLVEDQFHVSADDQAPERGKSAASFGIDFGGHCSQGSELFGIEERFVDALRARLEIYFLMKGCAFLISPGGRRFFH